MTSEGPAASGLAVSVHGPSGVLDLVVPAGASAVDVAREYAAESGLASLPLLHTRLGVPLRADAPLVDAGIGPGDLLVATTSVHRPRPPAREPVLARSSAPAGPVSVLWFAVSAGVAVLAGWFAAASPADDLRRTAVALLVVGAGLGVLPLGRYAAHRALAAPAFGGSAGLALAWDPTPEGLPLVLGVAGLAAAVTAALARALDEHVEEGLRVWMVTGIVLFGVGGLGAVLGLPSSVTWSVLLVGAMLAARFVPAAAIDVPDQLLIDLDRLAVTAWSAREPLTGRRGRAVASPRAIEAVARRGARIVTAASLAIGVVAVISAALLLGSVTHHLDLVGARLVVGFVAVALLLAARSHRHAAARALLRSGGLGCGVVLLDDVLAIPGHTWPALVGGAAVLAAFGLVAAAVATGRGWRSVWWSRRAEVAEGLAGAGALACVLISSGLFRHVWELGSRVSG